MFQSERLKRRREVQAKLECVVEDISKNSLEMMDSKLFVGDKVGMKQMKKKMASKPDTNIVFMSGLSQQETEEVETEGASSRRRRDSREEEREKRELMSSDEDVDTALALSLSSAGGPGGPAFLPAFLPPLFCKSARAARRVAAFMRRSR